MSYTALYRKWRPSGFEDVKGQEAIVQTLKNQIKLQRIGHAYLFCGTRGTGKTSVAKIFAKAVNCENPTDGSPCGECPTCRAIGSGYSLNVAEIDAASNNGVDSIREIREEVQYPPTEGRYRVYIIDEVHMLSTGAFNALLKTLEEPPSYVIFILATTEVHKIPVTVLSRCQRYDFKRIPVDVIGDRLRELTSSEHMEVEDKAIKYLAKAADGAMRDALSLLDQCAAFHYGEKLTYSHVLEVLGAVDTGVFSRLLRAVAENLTKDCILILEEMVMQGRDLGQFVIDFTWYMRNLLILKSVGDAEEMLDISSENLIAMKEEAAMVEDAALTRYIRIFSELSNQMRYAGQKRVQVELALIRLTSPRMQQDQDSVLERLRLLEERLDRGAVLPKTAEAAPAPAQPPVENCRETPREVALPTAQWEDLMFIREEWKKITGGLGGSLKSAYRDTVVEPGADGAMCVVFSDQTSYMVGSRPFALEELTAYTGENYGKTVHFQARLGGGDERFDTIYIREDDLKVIHMDITTED